MYYACDNILYFFHYHHFHSFAFYNVIYIEKSITCIKYIDINMLVGGSLGGAMNDLYGESTNKTGGRV
jgi:hypothetical protein